MEQFRRGGRPNLETNAMPLDMATAVMKGAQTAIAINQARVNESNAIVDRNMAMEKLPHEIEAMKTDVQNAQINLAIKLTKLPLEIEEAKLSNQYKELELSSWNAKLLAARQDADLKKIQGDNWVVENEQGLTEFNYEIDNAMREEIGGILEKHEKLYVNANGVYGEEARVFRNKYDKNRLRLEEFLEYQNEQTVRNAYPPKVNPETGAVEVDEEGNELKNDSPEGKLAAGEKLINDPDPEKRKLGAHVKAEGQADLDRAMNQSEWEYWDAFMKNERKNGKDEATAKHNADLALRINRQRSYVNSQTGTTEAAAMISQSIEAAAEYIAITGRTQQLINDDLADGKADYELVLKQTSDMIDEEAEILGLSPDQKKLLTKQVRHELLVSYQSYLERQQEIILSEREGNMTDVQHTVAGNIGGMTLEDFNLTAGLEKQSWLGGVAAGIGETLATVFLETGGTGSLDGTLTEEELSQMSPEARRNAMKYQEQGLRTTTPRKTRYLTAPYQRTALQAAKSAMLLEQLTASGAFDPDTEEKAKRMARMLREAEKEHSTFFNLLSESEYSELKDIYDGANIMFEAGTGWKNIDDATTGYNKIDAAFVKIFTDLGFTKEEYRTLMASPAGQSAQWEASYRQNSYEVLKIKSALRISGNDITITDQALMRQDAPLPTQGSVNNPVGTNQFYGIAE